MATIFSTGTVLRALFAAPLLVAAACGSGGGTVPAASGTAPPVAPVDGGRVTFTDVTSAAGIRFRHETGAFGKKYLPETMGSGCAWIDYDGDGRPDIFLVNGKAWPGHPRAAGSGPSYPALYHNRGDGTFEDVTARAGLAVESYGLGVAVGD